MSFVPKIRRRQGANSPDSRLYDDIQNALGQLKAGSGTGSGVVDSVLVDITIPAANGQSSQFFAISHGLGRVPVGMELIMVSARVVLTRAPTQPSGMDPTKQIQVNASSINGDTFGASPIAATVRFQ